MANTFRRAGRNFIASPYAITDAESVKFVSHFSYAAVGEIPEGYIDVPTMKWADFLQRYKIDRIDLFKMNIEGAEKEIVQGIDDWEFAVEHQQEEGILYLLEQMNNQACHQQYLWPGILCT